MAKKRLISFSIIPNLLVLICITRGSDEFMSCDRYFESRRESKVLEQIPCDMSKVSFCKHKGSAYPEAAIWRFKEENRALMRRMYGDMESTSVYRQMRGGSSMLVDPESHHQEDYDYDQGDRSMTLGSGFMPDLFSSLEYNIRMGSGLATVQSAKEPVVERIVENGMIKVKRKIVKKKKNNESLETTSTTTSTSSVFATTSEAPSPSSLSTTKVPSPTTATSQPSMTTTQPFQDDTVVTVSDTESSDTTTDFPFFDEPDLNAEVEEPIEVLETEYFQTEDSSEEIEDVEEIEYSGDSLNACPVKEEVFAPYWANNTRNQVLALLNLYPFEQYIHMETCKFEKEEMLCRKGCRCEQQYRLHRLLAFDPNNECRGIFSDWFRFPSYCICKCYNIPQDFIPKSKRKPKHESAPELKVDPKAEMTDAEVQNIPAFLPYEAKQALLRELSRRDRKQLPLQEMNAAAEIMEEVEEAQDSQAHFFYANAPVMEFNLANGNSGSVGQTPRK